MELIYQGKTKDVYRLEDDNYLLQFKDDVTGTDGVFDPGANTVGLTMEGAGAAGLRLTKFFFEKMAEESIPTHYIDADLEKATMTVIPAQVFGKGLEVICRYRAVGSFYKRYGAYVTEAQDLDALVEFTLKDDGREDPLAPKETLMALGVLTEQEYHDLVSLTKKIAGVVKEELKKLDLDLYDIKFEFGRRKSDNKVILIDEISGGNMRVYENGVYLEPMKLEKLVDERRKK